MFRHVSDPSPSAAFTRKGEAIDDDYVVVNLDGGFPPQSLRPVPGPTMSTGNDGVIINKWQVPPINDDYVKHTYSTEDGTEKLLGVKNLDGQIIDNYVPRRDDDVDNFVRARTSDELP